MHVISASLDRKVLDRLDGNARVKTRQTRISGAELAHRKTLNSIPTQESVDVVTDVVHVRRQFEGRVREVALDRGVRPQSSLWPQRGSANCVRPARSIESVCKQLLNGGCAK